MMQKPRMNNMKITLCFIFGSEFHVLFTFGI